MSRTVSSLSSYYTTDRLYDRRREIRVSRKNISKDVLNTVNKKTGKKVTPQEVQKLASGVKPSTVKSDAQLRQLIMQVSKMANVPVSESTIKEIIQAVKSSGLNPQQMEQMMKMMLGK